MSDNDTISNLIHQAEWYRLKNDYYNALRCFTKAEEKAKQRNLERKLAWIYAHEGETYFTLAQEQNDPDERELQEKHYQKALCYFNKALGLEEDEENTSAIAWPSLLKLERIRQYCNENQGLPDHLKYSWALAHRGETLRGIANQFDTPEITESSRDDIYEEALCCFKLAIRLYPDYPWAHAHLGATICNRRRIGEDGNLLSKEDAREALEHIEEAMNLADVDYAWAYAYRAATLVLSGHEKEAFYDIVIAVLQDENILQNLTYAPADFGRKLEPSGQLMEAMWQYLLATQRKPRDDKQRAYCLYYHAVFETKRTDVQSSPTVHTLLLPTDPKPRAKKALEHLRKQYGDEDPDVCYIWGGLTALEVTQSENGETEEQGYVDDAKKKLEKAISKSETYKEQARRDMAWYYMRNEIQDITKP